MSSSPRAPISIFTYNHFCLRYKRTVGPITGLSSASRLEETLQEEQYLLAQEIRLGARIPLPGR